MEPCYCPSKKHCHASLEAAKAHARHLKARFNQEQLRVAYSCGECPHYHVGRSKQNNHVDKHKGGK